MPPIAEPQRNVPDNGAPMEGTLSIFLAVETPKLKEHIDQCKDELSRRTNEENAREQQHAAELESAKSVLENHTKTLKHWQAKLELIEAGKSKEHADDDAGETGEEEPDENGDWDPDDVEGMRDMYPKHALMWWGEVPTDDEKLESIDEVEKATEAVEIASSKYKELEERVKEQENEVEDYEDAPNDETPKQKSARARAAKKAALTPEQLEEKRVKSEIASEKRKKTLIEKKAIIDDHPRLLKFEKGYRRAMVKVEAKNEEIGALEMEIQRGKNSVTKAQLSVRNERDMFLEYLSMADGKGENYDAEKSLRHFSRWHKSKLEEKKRSKETQKNDEEPPAKRAKQTQKA